MDIFDKSIKDHITEKIERQKAEPLVGVHITEIVAQVKEGLTHYGRKHNSLTCPRCIKSRSNGSRPVDID